MTEDTSAEKESRTDRKLLCVLQILFKIMLNTFFLFLFSELCWGKAMVAYKKHQQRKKEESERLRGERDQIKFINLGFQR